ncbi:putative aminopeptidase W07G4.4 [Erpetoichthys calabaricus]|uniref:Zgc:152830 n=1 Tax=Erpetoichthys calabaricus TaxID=27687 RepID=A0A8C4REQ3_ERPCA|nr:putative aminopeptidase W07G4.4 [Erpetoichthys calabaricus]
MGVLSVQPMEYTTNCSDEKFDGVVLISDCIKKLPAELKSLQVPLTEYGNVDAGIYSEVVALKAPGLPGGRMVFSSTGPLNRDYDDVRQFSDAAGVAINRAVKMGMKCPLLVCPQHKSFKHNILVAVLGALHNLYVPLELREAFPEKSHKVKVLGFWVPSDAEGKRIQQLALALESGRVAYRDIGGSDPERMAAPKVAEYIQELFKNTPVKVSIVSELKDLEKEYPCLAAVNRCANTVPRHRARVIKLEYTGEGPIDKTVLLVGKGITYDTGGADIKAGGIMAGMHRDKCGAAAVAGFFQVLAELKPKKLRVLGAMTMVRNSVGADCYVSDELIISRAQKRIRVGNTDAEGRMVMADLLCEMKEKALTEVAPELYTIATLTGHAIRAMGPHYSIIMDNGPARKSRNAQQWQEVGDALGDPFEISTIRREDFDFHKGKSEYEDILQCNNLPSSATPRGHQTPAAFLIMASGLDENGINSDKPLPYSHVDIAGSSGPFPGIPTGAPVLSMTAKFVLHRL